MIVVYLKKDLETSAGSLRIGCGAKNTSTASRIYIKKITLFLVLWSGQINFQLVFSVLGSNLTFVQKVGLGFQKGWLRITEEIHQRLRAERAESYAAS